MRRFKHLSFSDRLRIEAMHRAGYKQKDIAKAVHVDPSTISRELRRGRYTRLNSDYTTEETYSPDIAETEYREKLSAKGPALKIGADFKLAEFIEKKIIEEGYSPAAALAEAEASGMNFATKISVNTLYSYIDKGVFLNLTNKNLPEKKKKKRRYRKVKQARAPRGESIENRPPEVDERNTFAHWEMDCVEGKKGTKRTLLVLTERLTRKEFVVLMPDKTAASVVRALDRLERKLGGMFQKIFRSITVDNGSEFADCAGMERSARKKGALRTKIYYCHPYSAYERGSNEIQNRMIRRRFPKGFDFRKTTAEAIRKTEEWINNYPRRIFGYSTAQKEFERQVSALA